MEVPGQKALQRARHLALDYLARRDRSVDEVREKLLSKEFPETVVEQVVEGLQKAALLDDRNFARRWIESKMRNRPSGPARICLDLQRRGVERTIVEEILEEFKGVLGTEAEATALLRGQQWRYAGLEKTRAQRRMAGYLARRGYQLEIVYKAVKTVWEEMEQDDLEGS
ncbi:MAG: hypothetical protein GKR89_04535 [Candidatus Latescibacteria bacterium]|nr:hypothetical protein [Candidatus Latescibacterota bacterium]